MSFSRLFFELEEDADITIGAPYKYEVKGECPRCNGLVVQTIKWVYENSIGHDPETGDERVIPHFKEVPLGDPACEQCKTVFPHLAPNG